MSKYEINFGAIEEEAYIAACELVGPNDIEFERIYEREYDKLIEKWNKSSSRQKKKKGGGDD